MSTKAPVTAAVRALRAAGIPYSEHLYSYEERGGAEASSRKLGLPLHQVIKTLIMEDEERRPLVVLMHGDREVSTKELARQIGARQIAPCSPEVANRHSGYLVGGTSPFGLRRAMPLYLEASIADLERLYLNGGKRGFLVGMSPDALIATLKPTLVRVAT